MRKDDQKLIEMVRAGDLDCFQHLLARYQGLVFGVAYHILGNAEDAREVSQDVFIRAFTRLHQLKDPGNFGTWLRLIAVNQSRWFGARIKSTSSLDEVAEVPASSTDIDLCILLEQCLSGLGDLNRLTMELFYFGEHSMEEIAEFLGEPVSTIKSRLRNTRTRLRNTLMEPEERRLEAENAAGRAVQIIEAATRGDVATLETLLNGSRALARVSEPNSGQTALHAAAAAGHIPVIELLLSRGADVNAKDKGDNATPLHYASERGRLDVVKLLVAAGAEVNANDDLHERGPIGWAVVFGNVNEDVADYLLQNGARPDIFALIALDHRAEIQRLVNSDPNQLDRRMSKFEQFQTPIEFASMKGKTAIAQFLASKSGDLTASEAAGLGDLRRLTARVVEATEDEKSRALWISVAAGQVDSARFILERGADANQFVDVRPILFLPIGDNDEPMARLLIEFEADLEIVDKQWNSTALGWQVFFGNSETTALALRLGAKVGPGLIDLAHSGERGELRRFSPGTPDGYREVARLLENR